MKTAKIISFIAFIFNSLLTAYYALSFLRIRPIFQEVGVKVPFPWLLFVPAVFAIVSFIYWFYLKDKARKGEKVNFSLVVSIVLLLAPFILFLVMAITSGNQVLQMFNEFNK